VYGCFQDVSCPLVKAFTFTFGSHHCCGMNFGGHTQQHFTGSRFVRLLSQQGASGKIIVNRFMKSGFKFFNR